MNAMYLINHETGQYKIQNKENLQKMFDAMNVEKVIENIFHIFFYCRKYIFYFIDNRQ